MKYMLLIYDNEADWVGKSEAEQLAVFREYRELIDELRAAGTYLYGEPLEPTTVASTVRVRDGRTLVTDGPFAEAREQVGGFFLIEAPDLDAALAVAARIPTAKEGTIEVRPVQAMGELPPA